MIKTHYFQVSIIFYISQLPSESRRVLRARRTAQARRGARAVAAGAAPRRREVLRVRVSENGINNDLIMVTI